MNTINQSIHRQTYIGNTAFKAHLEEDGCHFDEVLRDVEHSTFGGRNYVIALRHNLGLISADEELSLSKVPLKNHECRGFGGYRYSIFNKKTRQYEEFVVKDSLVKKMKTKIIQKTSTGERTFSNIAEALYRTVMDSPKLLTVKPGERKRFILPKVECRFEESEFDTIREILEDSRFSLRMKKSALNALVKFVDMGKRSDRVSHDIMSQAQSLLKKYKVEPGESAFNTIQENLKRSRFFPGMKKSALRDLAIFVDIGNRLGGVSHEIMSQAQNLLSQYGVKLEQCKKESGFDRALNKMHKSFLKQYEVKPKRSDRFVSSGFEGYFMEREFNTIREILENLKFSSRMKMSAIKDLVKFVDMGKRSDRVSHDIMSQARDFLVKLADERHSYDVPPQIRQRALKILRQCKV